MRTAERNHGPADGDATPAFVRCRGYARPTMKVVSPLSTEATPTERYLAVQRSDEFAALRRSLRGFVFPVSVAFFLWYLLYVLLSAYARGFMSIKVVGNVNVALLFGLLQFVSTFLIAWWYSRFAARRFDPAAERIHADLTGAGPAATDATDPEVRA